DALRLAEASRVALDFPSVTSELVLHGLLIAADCAAVFCSVAGIRDAAKTLDADFGWKVMPIQAGGEGALLSSATPNAQRILASAERSAGINRIYARDLFAAILDVPESQACKWLDKKLASISLAFVRQALAEWPRE